MNNNDIIHKLIQNYRSGMTLEQPFYTNQPIFDLEKQHIWQKYWLFAGSTAEIPEAGNFFTYNIPNESVIIIRGNNGEIYGHYNACRHRGSLLCLEERGTAARLICPYHQWMYNKDGSLFKARLMGDDFDKSAYGLKSVHVRAVNGFIFISFAENPPDFSKAEADFEPFLSPFEIDKAKVGYRKRYELRTNWKLVGENFRECYHCGVAHPEYCNAVIGANLLEPTDNILVERRAAWKEKGLAIHDVEFEGDSFHFAIRYPLRPGVMSYSTDGKAIAKPMGQHQDYDAGVLGMVMYPNFWMDAVSDYMWTMRITPVSPSKTILDLTWLVDGNAIEGLDYTVERLTDFWRITGEQDWALCENNFKGIESSRYESGPYAPSEADVVKYIDWYIDRMKEGLKM